MIQSLTNDVTHLHERHQRQNLSAALSRLRGIIQLDDALDQLHAIVQDFIVFDDFLLVLRVGTSEWLEVAYAALDGKRQPTHAYWYDTAGLTGAVAQARHPLMTDDYLGECERRGTPPLNILHPLRPWAWVGVPLLDGGNVFGVLTLAMRAAERTFTSVDCDLLAAIALEATVCIRNAQRVERAERQARQFATLNRISRTVNSTLDPERVPALIIETAQELLNVEEGSLLLTDEQTGDLVFTYAGGPTGYQLLGQRLPYGVGIAGYVVTSGQSAIVNDTRRDGRFYINTDSTTGFVTRSLLAVPLRGRSGVHGVIEVMNRLDDSPFTVEDQELLEAVADQAVIALENAHRFAQVDQDLTRRARELDRLNDQLRKILRVSNALHAEQPLDELLDRIAQAVCESAGYQSTVIALVQRERTAHPYLQRLVGAGHVATEIERLRAAHASLADFEALLRPEFSRGRATYLIDRRRDDYIKLWGGSEQVYTSTLPSERPDGWHPYDTLFTLLRDSRGEIIGSISVDEPEDGLLPTHEQVQLLEILANQAAVAIENARLYAAQQHNLSRMVALNGLGMAMGTTLQSPAQIYEMTTIGMAEMTGAVGAAVLLPAAGQLAAAPMSVAFTFRSLVSISAPELEGLAHTVLSSTRPAIYTSPILDRATNERVIWLAVPLRAGQQTLGAICIGYLGDLPHPADLETLTLFAGQAAAAVDRLQLFEAVRRGRDQRELIMASTHEGMLLIDRAGIVAVANDAFVKLAAVAAWGEAAAYRVPGIRFASMLAGWSAATPCPLAEWERLRAGVANVAAGVEQMARGELNPDAPAARALEWTALSANDSESEITCSVLLVLRDITAAKQTERLRQDLTSMMVHDLRSPLASIITGIDMLFRGLSGEINETQRTILSIASTSAHNLLNLVNLLLDINRLEDGRMPLDRTMHSPAVLAQSAIDRLTPIAQDRAVKLVLTIDDVIDTVFADADLILRVLQNLLDNALKFSSPGEVVEVRVARGELLQRGSGQAAQPNDQGSVLFVVRDHGVGIHPRDHEKIFTKFGQAGTRRGGSGLGLTFCRLVIEAHGGAIWLESALGEGSTFYVMLPIPTGSLSRVEL